MKKVPLKKIVVLVTLGLILFMSKGMAQVEKGVTSTGKEVDCSTINPSVDKTVNEYGAIVTQPRLTRNGKLITDDCGCPVSIDCTNCTDTVNCISITMSAPILSGDVTSAVLQIFSDAGYTTQVGSDITATISDGKITAVAANLSCYTKYYLRLKLNNNSDCTFDWTDSTRDMTMEKVTTCTVGSVRALGIGTDLSHEHGYNGSTTEIDSVYDHEGNAYAVVQIGNQCWLRENMRATTTPDEHLYFVNPKHLTGINYTQSVVSRVAHWYKNDSTTYAKYGLLYNWCAAMNISKSSSPKVATGNDIENIWSFPGSTNHRGICPQGWHVPTDAECITMTNNVVTQYQSGSTPNPAWNQTDVFTGANTKIASMIAGGGEWKTSGSANRGPAKYNDSLRNITALSLIPGGYANPKMGGYTEAATFWTATQKGSSGDNRGRAWSRYIEYGDAGMLKDANFKYYGRSVRCVRDDE